MISSRKKREDFIEIEQIEWIYFLDKNGYWDERFRLEKKVETSLRLNRLNGFTFLIRMVIGTNDLV